MSVVSKIIVYPIKGFMGESVRKVGTNRLGYLQNDRICWAEIDGDSKQTIVNGKWANQIGNQDFWQINAKYVLDLPFTPIALTHSKKEIGAVAFLNPELSWKISAFLSAALGLRVGIRFAEAEAKQDNPVRCFSIISEDSLRTIADWFSFDFDSAVKRFRPNIIVKGLKAFEEYAQVGSTFKIGQRTYKIGGLIPRCSVPACDPLTGEKAKGFEKEFSQRMMEHIQREVPTNYVGEYRHGYYASVFAQLVSPGEESNDNFLEIGDQIL